MSFITYLHYYLRCVNVVLWLCFKLWLMQPTQLINLLEKKLASPWRAPLSTLVHDLNISVSHKIWSTFLWNREKERAEFVLTHIGATGQQHQFKTTLKTKVSRTTRQFSILSLTLIVKHVGHSLKSNTIKNLTDTFHVHLKTRGPKSNGCPVNKKVTSQAAIISTTTEPNNSTLFRKAMDHCGVHKARVFLTPEARKRATTMLAQLTQSQ